MSKEAWLKELETRLARLGEEEKNEALAYYREFFEESGDQTVPESFGTPREAAARIAGELALKPENPSKKVGLIALTAFAFPVAAPLGVALLAVAIALIVATLAVLGSLLIAGVAMAANGVLCLIYAFTVPFFGSSMTFFLGCGLACIGLGVLLTLLCARLIRTLYRAARRALANRLARRKDS